MRRGVRLGVDVGTVRVGVARSDPGGILATPLETLPRDRDGGSDLAALARIVAEEEVVEIVVGLPRSLSGAEGPSARSARSYAEQLAAQVFPAPVRLLDERLTTIDAQRQLRDAGRSTRAQRVVIDQVAAVLILQAALDLERSRGTAPGEAVAAGPARANEGRHE